MDDVLSNFLVKITYDQDQKSRKDFDEGLKQVQTHAAEFGDKIGALPAIVSEATKRISSSLSELYYSAQRNGATARELDALRYAATQSGEGADAASASFNAFSQRIRDFATGAARQYKSLFGVEVDPNHTMDAFLKVRDKIEELRNRGGAENLSRANLYARTFGIDEDALISGRMAIFKKAWLEQAKRNEGIAAEKAVALTRAYNALAAALETVARKADAALFDKFGAVLDRLTKWLDEDSERIVKFFTELATQIGLVFVDLSKLKPAFVLLWDALKEVGGWLEKVIGKDDTGLKGVRHLLEFISGVVMARFAVTMAAGFVAAFAPLTALLAALAVLGIISVGAYAAGEAVSGWLGGGVADGGGFGPEEGTASGGHGVARRRRFGHGGAAGAAGGGGAGAGAAGSDSGANLSQPKWWTPDRQKYIYDKLRAGGLSDMGAKGLVARWMYVESAGGPGSVNPTSGAVGLPQWLGSRKQGTTSSTSVDDQLAHVLRELDSNESIAGKILKNAKTKEEGAIGASAFERAEGYSARTKRDNFTNRTASGIERVGKAIGQQSIPQIAPDFHKRVDEIRAAKPLTPWQQSTNEIHDNRSVDNDVNIHVAGGFPVEKTERPLSRPKNADVIRNTASYAA